MTTNNASELRKAREQAGLTRAQLANLTGCSMSMLGAIEQGYEPKRSNVLPAAFAAIEKHNASK